MKLSDIYRHATERPDHLAAVDNGVPFSYRRFAGMIEVLRRHLASQPLPDGGIVAVMGGTLIYNWALQLAVRSFGFTTITLPSWEALDKLALCDLAAIAAFDSAYARWDHDPGAKRNCAALRIPDRLLTGSDTISLADVPEGPVRGDHILLSSGTTGRFKKILHRSADFAGRLKHEHDAGRGYGADDIVNMNLGEWTITGWLTPQCVWSVGATMIFDLRKQWIDHVFDYPVSAIVLLGSAITQVARSELRQPAHYPRLKIRSGGGFIPQATIEILLERFDCLLFNSYAGSEFSVALVSITQNADDFLWLKPTSAAFELVDDDGRPVPDNVAGNVRVRLHPWDPQEYHDEPEATARFFRDGCFYPGDLALRRADGRVRILGRVNDVLVIAGQKVPVAPHEKRAQEVLGVDGVCLFARQTDAGRVVLMVVVEGNTLPPSDRLEKLSALYRHAFNDAKFVCLPRFPRGTNGMDKINRQALLEMLPG